MDDLDFDWAKSANSTKLLIINLIFNYNIPIKIIFYKNFN